MTSLSILYKQPKALHLFGKQALAGISIIVTLEILCYLVFGNLFILQIATVLSYPILVLFTFTVYRYELSTSIGSERPLVLLYANLILASMLIFMVK